MWFEVTAKLRMLRPWRFFASNNQFTQFFYPSGILIKTPFCRIVKPYRRFASNNH
jgi:hypothetical protein